MVTMICQLDVLIHDANNLKEKRSIVKSIIDRTKNKYSISIIESGYHKFWQKAQLGLSFCSMETRDAEKKLEKIIRHIESNPYIEIYDINKEQIHF